MRKNILRILGVTLLIGLGYLAFWPIDMHPRAYDAPADPGLVGDYALNTHADAAEHIQLPEGEYGPEDIAVLPDGSVFTTSHDGALIQLDGTAPKIIEHLGGRPLGLTAGPDGAIYIADSFRGLMRWTGPGTLTPLATEIEGAPIIYANQVAAHSDGSIFFSNSSDRFDPETLGGTSPTSVMTIWEQSDTGYVAHYTANGTVKKIAEGFVYTNGVALSPAEDFLLIAETGRARIHKHWLTGAKAGQTEVLMDNLPGYPDNIEPVGDGTYWMAFASPRSPVEFLMPMPFLRKVIWRMGPAVRPTPIAQGIYVHFDGTGKVLRVLHDPSGRLGVSTGAKPVGDELYLTSLTSPGFGRMKLSDLPAEN